ncbi:MAG: hypothetical protein K0S23_52 [Fluviicola sp.]|jgi:hypothetical protein|uniref:hypothetical protein n=1 Tax=Fluviicola sp. TaxID=1917219 RepID=UPI0026027883|nr:hypothetical protein [Fluviicola sp.]MDF3025745.1 hypothetical protein [Fluviicola sp.]
MATDLFPFKVLFCFEDTVKLIAEIKRTDIQTEDKSIVYKWLLIDKSSREVRQLTFLSMDQSEGEQIRNFAEGTLSWNAAAVDFNGKEMDRNEPDHMDTKWLEIIAGFLI